MTIARAKDIISATGLLEVSGLTVQVATPTGARTVVDNLSFTLESGKTLCIAGESGSGKSIPQRKPP